VTKIITQSIRAIFKALLTECKVLCFERYYIYLFGDTDMEGGRKICCPCSLGSKDQGGEKALRRKKEIA